MKRINILFIFIFSVPSATFSQQSDFSEKVQVDGCGIQPRPEGGG